MDRAVFYYAANDDVLINITKPYQVQFMIYVFFLTGYFVCIFTYTN